METQIQLNIHLKFHKKPETKTPLCVSRKYKVLDTMKLNCTGKCFVEDLYLKFTEPKYHIFN